jgi:hypothetical protein
VSIASWLQAEMNLSHHSNLTETIIAVSTWPLRIPYQIHDIAEYEVWYRIGMEVMLSYPFGSLTSLSADSERRVLFKSLPFSKS